MKRLLLIILFIVGSISFFAQSREQKLREIELKMQAVEKLSDNEIAYWSVMPEIVELMEQAERVDTTYVRMLTRLGHYYSIKTDLHNAAKYFGRAYNIATRNKTLFRQLTPTNFLETAIGYSSALHHLDSCAKAIHVITFTSNYLLSLNNDYYLWQELETYAQLADYYSKQWSNCFNKDSAHYYVNRAISGISRVTSSSEVDIRNERHLRCECAEVLMYVGDSRKALDIIRNEVSKINENNPSMEDGLLANVYSECQFCLGNYTEAMRFAKIRLDQRKNVIRDAYFVMSEQERNSMSQVFVEKDLILPRLLSSVIYTEDYSIMGEIYNYVLFVKQLQLRTTKQVNDAIRQSGDKQLLAYFNEYNSIRAQLAHSNPAISINRDSLLARQESIGRLLSLHSNQLITSEIVTWRDIQNKLGNGEAAIEFVKFDLFEKEEIVDLDCYVAMVITQHCKQPLPFLITTERYLTQWKTENLWDLHGYNQYGNAIAQWIWADMLYYFDRQGINNIYFAPCGVLNQIAIESLPFDKESTVSYHYNLTRLSSTRELVNKHNLHPNKSVTLYGDLFYRASAETMQQATTRSAVGTLPYSKQEINEISLLLSGKQYHVNRLSQKQGTEASFKSLSGKSPSILHLSTHGFVNRPIEGDAMQRSGLIMAYGARAWEGKSIPENTEDGILTAAEIATLDLSGTDIVVLSACNTALGEVTTEGVWGLQRAFKQAGAQTIVMSLWQVDDEATAVFMQYFYEALLKGRQALAKAVSIDVEIAEHIFNYPHDALATAQRRMRQHPKYSAPYYWAGFIVVD